MARATTFNTFPKDRGDVRWDSSITCHSQVGHRGWFGLFRHTKTCGWSDIYLPVRATACHFYACGARPPLPRGGFEKTPHTFVQYFLYTSSPASTRFFELCLRKNLEIFRTVFLNEIARFSLWMMQTTSDHRHIYN